MGRAVHNADDPDQMRIKRIKEYEIRRRKIQNAQNKVFIKGGHGRKNIYKKYVNLRGKLRNYRETVCHQVSSDIVDFLQKEGVEVVFVENLSNIKKQKIGGENIYTKRRARNFLNNFDFLGLGERGTFFRIGTIFSL